MGKINMGRVILGGLLAGLVINVSESILNVGILAKENEDALKALNRPPIGNEAVTFLVILGFVLGILAVWLYAAIRPRFGAGPMTAVCAGLTVWALAYLYPSGGMMGLKIFPNGLIFWGLIWGLFEMPIAALVGAWVYKEDA